MAPIDLKPDTVDLNDAQIERYARHLILDQFDEEGQHALRAAHILMVGVGGIGAPASLYLAAAGLARLRLLDDDQVETSNLQRQVLFRQENLGQAKVQAAKDQLNALNPECQIELLEERLIDLHRAQELIEGLDLVIDGSDTYETRCLVAQACLAKQVPLISASASQFDGQLAFLRPWRTELNPCYKCLFPKPPGPRRSCAEAGVFGPLVGTLGAMAAGEAIKHLIGRDICDQSLMSLDGLSLEMHRFKARKRADCRLCKAHRR